MMSQLLKHRLPPQQPVLLEVHALDRYLPTTLATAQIMLTPAPKIADVHLPTQVHVHTVTQPAATGQQLRHTSATNGLTLTKPGKRATPTKNVL